MPLLLIVAAGVLAIDRLTKGYVRGLHPEGGTIPVIPGVFHITPSLNSGAAFGLFPNMTWLFIVVAVVVVIFILLYGLTVREVSTRLALGLIMGGALGNLVDRLTTGLVVDFLDFRIWPVFNLADSAIVVGALLLTFRLLRDARGERPQ